MKKGFLLALTLLSPLVFAEYKVKIILDKPITFTTSRPETWTAIEPIYGNWENSGFYSCSNWSPDLSMVSSSQTTTQTSNDCSIQQVRSRQEREQSDLGNIRNSAPASSESRMITNQTQTRPYTIAYSNWIDQNKTTCTSWSPDSTLIPSGKPFTRNGTGCTVYEYRTRNDSYVDTNGSITNLLTTTENRTRDNQTTTMTAYGTGTYDTTSVNLTDGNWTKGIAKRWAGFFVPNTEANRNAFAVGRSVKFANGDIRQIGYVVENKAYFNIYCSGDIMDGNVVGYPNHLELYVQ